MTKNSKKLVSILLALVMVLTIIPIGAMPTFALGDVEAVCSLVDNTELLAEDGTLSFNDKLDEYGVSSLDEFIDENPDDFDYDLEAPVFKIHGMINDDWYYYFDITLDTNDFTTAEKIASAKIVKVEFHTTYYGDVDDQGVFFPVTPAHTHNSNAYGSNATQHWTKCTDDNDNNGTPVNHTWSNGKCSVCQYECKHTGMTASDAACATCSMANPNYVAPVQEKSVTITADETGGETYTRSPITIVTKGGDSDGGECMKDKPITISASGSNKITKVEITVGFKAGNASPKFATTAGKIQTPYSTETGSKITITDLDNTTVTLTNSDAGLWQLIAFQVYYTAPAHTHNSNAYGSNATQHWTKCTDDNDNNGTAVNHTWSNGKCSVCQYTCVHTGGTATCTTQAVCGVCGVSYGNLASHSFTTTASTVMASEATCTAAATYYVKCDNCTAVNLEKTVSAGNPASHSFTTKASSAMASEATCTAAATYYVQCDNCTAVSLEKTVAVGQSNGHSFATTWSYDDNTHWYAATCGHTTEKKDEADHTYGTTGADRYTCTVCAAVDNTKKAEAEASDLAAAKTAAKLAVGMNTFFDSNDDIEAIANQAYTDIDNAATIADVNAIKDQAIADINVAKQAAKDLADAKAEAIEALNALVADEKATDKMKAIANEGIEAVNAATSIDEVKLLLKDYTAKVNAENEKENVKDESCKNPVSGLCYTYNKYEKTSILGIILGFVHQIVHFFHFEAMV